MIPAFPKISSATVAMRRCADIILLVSVRCVEQIQANVSNLLYKYTLNCLQAYIEKPRQSNESLVNCFVITHFRKLPYWVSR